MNCFVTGASGFVGANLVHELLARGHSVKALLRPGSRLARDSPARSSSASKVTSVTRSGSKRPCGAATGVFTWPPAIIFGCAITGPCTRRTSTARDNVIQAAAAAGCARIVYTSTVGCIGLPAPADGPVVPTDETTPVSEAQMSNHYKRSKWQAEQAAIQLARKGLPVIIVNPSTPIGPRDVKPTPTGKVIVDFLNRQMPAYLETGLNWVHVRDVAVGHILAAEKGRLGERYILGNADGELDHARSLRRAGANQRCPGPENARALLCRIRGRLRE